MSADLCSSADVFERSRTWFLGLESGNHVSIECEMRRLVGLWLCEKISEKESFEFSQIAGNLARRIAALPDKAGILQIDSKLWLLSHRILEMCGEGVPSLGELCRTISRELVGRGTYSGYEGEAVILGRLGLLPPPIVGRMIDLDSNRIVRGTVSELRAVADDIFASTLFGGRRLQSPRYPSLTSMAMGCVVLERLRRYDLELGATLLRAASYANMLENKWAVDAAEFVACQQLPEGYFGHYAQEEEVMLKQIKVATGTTEALNIINDKVRIPVTVACLWVLAELTKPKFRVLHF